MSTLTPENQDKQRLPKARTQSTINGKSNWETERQRVAVVSNGLIASLLVAVIFLFISAIGSWLIAGVVFTICFWLRERTEILNASNKGDRVGLIVADNSCWIMLAAIVVVFAAYLRIRFWLY